VTETGRPGNEAYRRAGVDLEAASRAVDLIANVARSASRTEVRSRVGGFAGLVDLGDGRLLAASTDGVGTKLDIARRLGKLDTVGIDCVAMCANDVLCTGAEPLFFLDYLAVEKLVPEEVSSLVSGVAEGCRQAACALLGGETAEHPEVLPAGSFDLAGFCVGLVRREGVLDPGRVRPGDALLAFRSSGLHSNGFSLVRRAIVEADLDLGGFVPELGRTLGEELLEPTLIYVRPVLDLIAAGFVRSASHITGGGLMENLPRALPGGLRAVVDTSSWTPQPIFELVARAAGVESRDLFGVLNMGLGFVVVTAASDADQAIRMAKDSGWTMSLVGEVGEGSGILLR
jgi:phosphoribosylformylglycinamidine cyclo-ligase